MSQKADRTAKSTGSMTEPAVLVDGKNAILSSLARGAPLEATLARLAKLVEMALPPARVAIGLSDADMGRLDILAAPSLPADFVQGLDPSLEPARTPLAAAVLRREPVVASNLKDEARWPGHKAAALSHGLAACLAVPILDGEGGALGVAGLFWPEPHMPTADEYQALDSLLPLLGLALLGDRQERQLRHANQRLASLAANLPGVIYQRIVKPDGTIRYTYISEGAREIFGVSPAEILADPNALFARHGPEYKTTFRENLLRASRELRLWDVEAQIITREGKEKWTHAIARPRREPDGTVVWDGIILDATRLKRANMEMAAANKAKSEFLANMSHELRTPLNAVIGFAQIMTEGLFGPLGDRRYTQYVEDILASGQHLLAVINDILDLSRIEAGKMDMFEEYVETRQIIDNSLRLVRERASASNIQLTVTLPDDLPSLYADDRKLKQMLLNLLSNAVKFTPSGGRIEVSVRPREDGGLDFAVADTGIGISPEHLLRVTEPFLQVDSGIDRRFEGTGLGLALTKRMIELHGGRLELVSALGIGTTVTLWFPPSRVSRANPPAPLVGGDGLEPPTLSV